MVYKSYGTMLQSLTRIRRLDLPKQFRRASHQYVEIENTDDGYSIITMKKAPVNSINLELMQEMRKAFDEVEKDKTTRGVIITSNAKAFCAGIDLNELVNPDPPRLDAFWSSIQELLYRAYSSPLVTIAAINGTAIAGGCALSLSCDYRVMAQCQSKIGLNTVHTGLIAPYWVDKLYAMAIGHRQADRLLCLGVLSTPDEALCRGIVDRVVPADDLLLAAVEDMKKWLSIPDIARRKTKELMRREFIEQFDKLQEQDAREFKEIVYSDAFQSHVASYVQKLKKK